MKILLGVAALVAALSFPSNPQTDAATTTAPVANEWQVDGGHSSVVFKIKHAGASWFYGMFTNVTGKVVFDADKPEACSVTVEIDAESVQTRDEKRDQHLRGPDFFDSKQYPAIQFTSTGWKKSGSGFEVAGDLELRGVKKSVTANVTPTGTGEFYGKRAGFEATFVVKRSDFGMDYGVAKNVLGDEVHMTVAIEAVQAEAKKQ